MKGAMACTACLCQVLWWMNVSVCLHIKLAYLRNNMAKLLQILCVDHGPSRAMDQFSTGAICYVLPV